MPICNCLGRGPSQTWWCALSFSPQDEWENVSRNVSLQIRAPETSIGPLLFINVIDWKVIIPRHLLQENRVNMTSSVKMDVFWSSSHWNPNRITSRVLSFILTAWGNHRAERSCVARALICFHWGEGQRVYVPVWTRACAVECVAATLFSHCQTALTWQHILKWHQSGPLPHFHPILWSLTPCHLPPSPRTPAPTLKRKIKWFIKNLPASFAKVKTWKIKDRKGLSENLVQYILHSSPFPFVSLFLTE